MIGLFATLLALLIEAWPTPMVLSSLLWVGNHEKAQTRSSNTTREDTEKKEVCMTEKEKASTSDEERHALALATTQGDPVEEQSEDTKRKIYFALAAVSVVVLLFGAMRLGNLSGMGSGQGVQCTAQYTTCVLGCNKQSVTISQKIQSGATEAEKNKWEKRLLQVQTRCIPMCYQVHCVGKTPKEAAAALKLNAKTQAN